MPGAESVVNAAKTQSREKSALGWPSAARDDSYMTPGVKHEKGVNYRRQGGVAAAHNFINRSLANFIIYVYEFLIRAVRVAFK